MPKTFTVAQGEYVKDLITRILSLQKEEWCKEIEGMIKFILDDGTTYGKHEYPLGYNKGLKDSIHLLKSK